MKNHSRFVKGSGVYVCITCGKSTRETGEGESGVRLCKDCYERAGIENEIADGIRNADGTLKEEYI